MNKENRDFTLKVIDIIIAILALVFGSGLLWRFLDTAGKGPEDTAPSQSVTTTDDPVTESKGPEATAPPQSITTTDDPVAENSGSPDDKITDGIPTDTSPPEGSGRAVDKNPYGNININYIVPFNTDKFILTVDEAALKITADQMEDRWLGVFPEETIPATVSLIDFSTNKIVETQNTFIGGTVSFFNLSDGTYYYEVTSSGYKTYIPDTPFRLEQNPSLDTNTLNWMIELEQKDATFKNSFKVQLVDANGNPLSNIQTSVRCVSIENSNPTSTSSLPMKTDRNGYLTMWMNINGVDYNNVATFYLIEGFTLQIEGRNGDFLSAQPTNSGVCIITH